MIGVASGPESAGSLGPGRGPLYDVERCVLLRLRWPPPGASPSVSRCCQKDNMSAPAAHKPGAPHAEHKGTHATPSLASTHTQGGHKHQHHHTKVKFARSRHEFRRLAAHAGLIFSDFSTSRDNVKHASSHRNGLTSSNESSYVSLGLSFSAVQNGLPFDFALQPGLVHVATRRRRLAEDMRERAVDSPLLPPPPVPTTAALAPSPRPWSSSPASASDGWPSLSPPQPGQLFAAANSAWAEWARRWMDRMEQWAAPSLDAHAPADLIAVEAGDAEEEEEVVEEARFSKGRSLGQRSLRSRTRVMVRRRRRNPLHHLAHDGIDPQPQAQQQAHQQLVQQQVHQPRALGGSMERGPRRNRRLLREISKESESHGPSGTAAAASTKAAGGGGADSPSMQLRRTRMEERRTQERRILGPGPLVAVVGGGHAAGAHAAGAHAAGRMPLECMPQECMPQEGLAAVAAAALRVRITLRPLATTRSGSPRREAPS